MDSRVAKIEAVLPMLASKGDVSEAKAAIIMWMAGLIFAAVALILTVLTVVLNRVVPPAASQQPIVIQLPATPNITSPVQKKP